MSQVFYDFCNDVAFKKVFNQHAELTIKFLNATLKLEGDRAIKSVQFLPQEQLPIISESKKSILDVKCTDQRGFQYIVEVQNKPQLPYLKRIQFYTSHAYASQLKVAQSYLELKPVTMLSILNHNLFPAEIGCLSFYVNVEKTTSRSYLEDMSYAFIELPKFNKSWNECTTLEDYWIYLLKESHHMQSIPKNVPDEIKEALQILEEHSWSGVEREAYIKAKMIIMDEEAEIQTATEKGRAEGKAEGKAEGIAEGMEKGKIETARNLLLKGMDLKFIMDVTGLSKDEIKKLS